MSLENQDIAHFDIKREDLMNMISQLEQSLYNHQQWYNSLIRTLICKLPPDLHDLSQEAWQECRFGQWYYHEAYETLKNHQGFKALGEEHKRMHIIAKDLLEDMQNGKTIEFIKYDNFSNSLDRLRLEISALKRELEDLLYNRDSLTGLLTRVNILPILREFHEISRRGVHSYCLVMMDLDNFKAINDTEGHVIGDKVLAEVSHFLLHNLRSYDKIFRYGGEEFLICLQDTNLPQAYELIERLRKSLSDFKISINNTKEVQVTASFGVTLLNYYAPLEESIANADEALYLSKRSGRNMTKVWEENVLKKE